MLSSTGLIGRPGGTPVRLGATPVQGSAGSELGPLVGSKSLDRWLYVGVTLAMLTELTGADRCDRCGAQAFYRVTLTSGELLFCAHHGQRYMPTLREVALDIEDHTDLVPAVI